MLHDLVISVRPKQWIKNLVVFLALGFSLNQYWQIGDLPGALQLLARVGLAFVFFCLLSSSQYLINDVVDLEKDRRHPRKALRPIAAGRVQPGAAVTIAVLLAALAIGGSFLLTPMLAAIAASYLVLTLLYSLLLKHLVIVDVFVIAAGFLLRAAAGAVAIAVPISPWLYLVTILGALFLGFCKRRHELVLLEEAAKDHRPILKEYTPELLEEMIAVVTSSTVMAYSLYTFTAEGLPKNHAMMLTIPFVLYGVFRYLFLVHRKKEGGSPEEALLQDVPLMVDIALWLVASLSILALFR